MLKNKFIKLTIIVLSIIIGLWFFVLVALQILLKTSVLDKIISKVATEFVEGDVHYSRVKINVVKSFPNLNVTIDSLSLTYPHDRWARWDTTDVLTSHLLNGGRGTERDTLASFETFSASIDYVAAIRGRIRSRGATLSGAKFYAHKYGEGQANWQMFRTSAPDTTEVKDTTAFTLPPISVDRIVLDNNPYVVYTAQEDTVFLGLYMNELVLRGDLEKYLSDFELLERRMDSTRAAGATNAATRQRRTARTASSLKASSMESTIRRDSTTRQIDINNSSIALHIDSLLVGGRLPQDTVVVLVSLLDVQDHGRRIAFETDATATFLTRVFGRLQVPVHLSGEVGVAPSRRHKESIVYQLRQFNGSVAYVPLLMDAMVRRSPDSLYMNVAMKIDDCPVGDILEKYGKNFSSSIAQFHTDARLTLTADGRGFLDFKNGVYPKVSAALSLPEASISHDNFPSACEVALNADASLTEKGRLDVILKRLLLDVDGLYADFSGKAANLLGRDPQYTVKGMAESRFDDLVTLIPDSVGPIDAKGRIHLDLDASARQSYLCKKGLMNANMNLSLTCNRVDVSYPKIGLTANIDTMTLKVNDMKSLVDSTQRALGARLNLDSLYFTIGESLALSGSNIKLLGNLAAKKVDATVPVPQFKGKLVFDRLEMTGPDSMRVRVTDMDNTYTIDKYLLQRRNITTPRITLSSSVRRISARVGDNRFGVNGVQISLSSIKRQNNAAATDSIIRRRRSFVADTMGLQVQLPDFVSDKDFEKSDIDVKVSESVTEYLSTWYPQGNIEIARGRVITPLFPLRNRIDTVRVRYNGNSITVDKFGLRAGASNISATGSIRRHTRPGVKPTVSLKMDVTSDCIDVNELLTAWNQGQKLKDTEMPDFTVEQSTDADYMETLLDSATAQISDTTFEKKLIVVPANLLMDVNLLFDSVRYSTLLIDTLRGGIVSKGRCLQFTDWMAQSNMGTMKLDAFYSTRNKQDISAGFNLGMYDITANEVISLIPLVDSVMPLLKTFQGDLGCELTATTQIDTCMNIILPTLNGVFKIGGKNLRLEESAALRKIARLLLFRNKKTGEIDDMSIYGLISDNMLEVFPFILNVDRYTLALEGHQDLDMPFEYYLSVISSPLPFQFGISLYGDNYDDWKYRLGPTKYKHSYYIPLFNEEVDSVQVNLVSAIRTIFDKGVDRVLRESARHASAVDSIRAESRDLPPVDEEKRGEMMKQYEEIEKEQFDENTIKDDK